MNEFWSGVLFVVVLPLLQQLIKWISDQYGYTFEKWLNQLISLVLAVAFTLISGGFAGVELPVWSGDLIQFIGQLLTLITVSWGASMVLYEAIWDRLFVKLGFATQDKLG